MSKKSQGASRSAKTGKFTVGRQASVHISRIEGLTFTRDMKETFRSFDKQGLSNEARRTALIAKYGKKDR